MKKIIGVALITAMLFQTSVFAADRTLTDAAKGTLKISGTAQGNARISVLITNPGYTYETADSETARQYIGSFKADADGTYEHNVVLNMDNASSGYFKIYVKEGDAQVCELDELYFASVSQKYTEMKRVLEDTSLVSADAAVKNVFGLNEQLYSAIDMSVTAQKLDAYLEENPISVSDDDTDDEKLEKFTLISNKIKEIAVIEAYNGGKSNVLFGLSQSFLYDDVLGLSSLDSDKDVTVYALYKDSLTDAGRTFVQNSMLNNDAESVSDLQKIFAKSVMLSGVQNHKDKGYGHISSYITQKNVSFATGSTDGKTDVDTYLNLADKSNANYYIKQNAKLLTSDNFMEKVEYYAKTYGSVKPGSSGGFSGTGGGKTEMNVVIPAAEILTNEENNEDIIGETSSENTASGVFKDVYDNFWGKDAIEFLYKKGVINGVSEDMFAPDDNLTREQAVKILCTAFSITDIKDLYFENGITYDNTDYTMFDDVTQYDWYGEYVFAAYRNNIVNGVSERTFGVGMNVTRQDIAAMIYRVKKGEGADGDLTFADASDISDYAKDAVSYMKSSKIINGYEDNTFRPNNFITRAEIAQIMYNILSKEG